MSCTVQIKTRNSVKAKKVNNVVHRTTSETIRLGDPDLLNNSRQLNTVISPPPLKQSSCSFQVTSVSVAQRTDCGDDSADDLDESHTDDISRVTDNETPSYSEDTCSRDAEDNYAGYCSALCSVTVIPSSSQYGLAIMPLNTSSANDNTITNKASDELNKTTTESHELSGSDVEVATSRFPGTRFKVVKVETSTPFRRGRWWCMDYLDESPYAPKNAFTYKSSEGLEICSQLQYTMTATSVQAQPFEENVESGTNYSISNYVAPTQSIDTATFPACSVSEKTQRFIIHHENETLKVQSHLHVPVSNYQMKNKKNGSVPKQQNYCVSCEQKLTSETINCQCSPSTQIEHSEICDLTKSQLLESSINENLELDINSLSDLSLTNIIQNSLQQKLKESGTVSSYLAWELFSQTPLCAVTTQNSHIFDKCLNENSTNGNTIQTPTTQANTSLTQDSVKVMDSNLSGTDSSDIDASVMPTFPLISGRFSIFDDISILATRAIIDNFSNS